MTGGRTRGPILVVECDASTGRAMAEQLAADGFSVELARTAEHARILAAARSPTLVVLGSLEAPRGALALLEEIRRTSGAPWDASVPALVMAPRGSELDLLRAYEAGADDFLPRPATYVELRARLRALLRRTAPAAASAQLIAVGPLEIDRRTRVVAIDGRGLRLRRMEFELLAHLAAEPERVFARDELLRAVWEYRAGGSTRTVDSHASRLRRKLAPDGERRWIVSVWGVGYRLI